MTQDEPLCEFTLCRAASDNIICMYIHQQALLRVFRGELQLKFARIYIYTRESFASNEQMRGITAKWAICNFNYYYIEKIVHF